MSSTLAKIVFTNRSFAKFCFKNPLIVNPLVSQFLFHESLKMAITVVEETVRLMRETKMEDIEYFVEKKDFFKEMPKIFEEFVIKKKKRTKVFKDMHEEGVNWYLSNKVAGTELIKKTAIRLLNEYDSLMLQQHHSQIQEEVLAKHAE